MRLLHRYTVQEFLLPFIYCIVTFTFLCVMVDLFGHLDEILKLGISTQKLLSYYWSFVPLIFVQAAPMAVLLSTMYVLGTFQRHREIVAMKASGLSVRGIIMPFLFLGLLVSASAYMVNEKLVPKANMSIKEIRAQTFEKEKKPEGKEKTIYDVAILGKNNRIYYARSLDITLKLLQELIILEHRRNLTPIRKITAKEAIWIKDGWVGKGVIYYRLSPNGAIVGTPLTFDEKHLDIQEKPQDFLVKSELQVELMNYKELMEYRKQMSRANPRAAQRIAVDLYQRLAFPLTSLVVTLVGIPFALRSKRSGAFVGFGMAIALSLLYYAFNATCIAMGKGQFLPPILAAWLANLVFAGVGVYLTGRLAT